VPTRSLLGVLIAYARRVGRAANPGPEGNLELVLSVAGAAALASVLTLIGIFWAVVLRGSLVSRL